MRAGDRRRNYFWRNSVGKPQYPCGAGTPFDQLPQALTRGGNPTPAVPMETPRLRPGRTLPLELHLHQLAVVLGHFEHGAWLQFHEAGHKHFRDLADASVVGVDVVVKKLAAVGDAVFEFADAGLQLEKVFVGLELRIIFGHGKQPPQGAGHHRVSLRLLPNAGRVHRRGTGLRHGDQRLLLMLHVTLYRLDQVWDLVVTLLEQHVNVGPRAVVVIAQTHQFVVEDDYVDHHSHGEQQERRP